MYTVDQLAVRDLARSFAQTEVEPGAMLRDRESLFASTLIAKLGEMGFMGMLIPEHYGGAGQDFIFTWSLFWQGSWCIHAERTERRVGCLLASNEGN